MDLAEIKAAQDIDRLRKIKDVASDYVRDLEFELQAAKNRLTAINQRIKHLSEKD